MEEQAKSFIKGLNMDVDYKSTPDEIYIDAHNIRLVNDKSGSSMSLNNIKGNEFNITIPDTTRIQKITITDESLPTSITIDATGTPITGNTYTLSGLNYKQLYKLIITDTNFSSQIGNLYNFYYGDNYLIMVPEDGVSVADITQTGGGLSIDPNFVPAQQNLEIIGSTTIRGDIYLFTTNSTSKTPTSVGQIWKYTYDKISLTGSLKLKYNNWVNFSTYWCITPTAALGRYENNNIQRLYWTDNYNKLRSLNVANSQSLAVDVSILDITPSVDFDIPLLVDNINAGGPLIKIGAYQCAYRLKNSGGAVTAFSELSNLVFIGEYPDRNSGYLNVWKNSVGSAPGTMTSQQISWTINNIDRDFDRIEVAIIRKDTINGTPTIMVLDDIPIQSDNEIVNYNGGLNETPITTNEFLALSGVFTHCKTIATKDNRLFVANIRNEQSELDFDTRAYSFNNDISPTFALTDNGTTTTGYTTADYDLIPENSDAINPDRSIYRYKSDGVTLGGEGKYISYEYITVATSCDTNGKGGFAPAGRYLSALAPWRSTNPNYTTDAPNLNMYSVKNNSTQELQKYTNLFTTGKVPAGFHFQDVNGLYKGYQRNETYRFGIQFFDKQKNPYFVKWIADIQLPDHADTNINSIYEDGTPTAQTDFRLSFVDNQYPVGGYDECFVQSLGIKIKISKDLLDLIKNDVSGYTIVRVKRQEKDKSIIDNGIVNFAIQSTNLLSDAFMTSIQQSSDGNVVGFNAIAQYDSAYFATPNMCDGSLTGPAVGMQIKVKGILGNVITQTRPYYYLDGNSMYCWKLYDFSPVSNGDNFDILETNAFGFGGYHDGITPNNMRFHNCDFDQSGTGAGHGPSYSWGIGNSCYYLGLSGELDYSIIPSNGKLFVTIERIISDQYGGNTYTARSTNEYIACSNFRPIRNIDFNSDDNFLCFGGDVFVNMADSMRWSNNRGIHTDRLTMSRSDGATFYYPMESSVNTDLRNGVYANYSFDSGTVINNELIETFTYNTIYSSEDDLKTYFPKPDPYFPNKEWDNRFYCSDIKINGELIDSWGLFKETNVWDVEGVYGPINAIEILKDKLYFWQNRAFGIMEVNPRSVVTDINNTSNANLQLGTGLPLQRHDYISTEIGLQHQYGVTKSSYSLFWVDVANKKFYQFGGEGIKPLSDVQGMFSYFTKNLKNNILNYDKPVYMDSIYGLNGVRCVYDFKYNQAIFTFTDSVTPTNKNYFTILYDENIGAFTSFAGFTPRIYMSDGYKIFSSNPNNLSDIYIHDSNNNYCQFYGNVYTSKISFPINKFPASTKVFDNLRWDSQSTINGVNQYLNTWSRIRCYNGSQNTDWQDLVVSGLTANLKRKERSWKTYIARNRVLNTLSQSPDIFDPANLSSPNNKPFGDRLRDKYIIVDLEYDNDANALLTTNNVICDQRVSDR